MGSRGDLQQLLRADFVTRNEVTFLSSPVHRSTLTVVCFFFFFFSFFFFCSCGRAGLSYVFLLSLPTLIVSPPLSIYNPHWRLRRDLLR